MTGRAQLVLNGTAQREQAIDWVRRCRPGSRVEFKGPQRSVEQNDKMWAMLTDIATQHTINGRAFRATDWKEMCLAGYAEEMGIEIRHLPAIHRAGLIPVGRSSSDLSVREMSEFIEWIYAYGAENGVEWSDPKEQQQQAEEPVA